MEWEEAIILWHKSGPRWQDTAEWSSMPLTSNASCQSALPWNAPSQDAHDAIVQRGRHP
jgi:hypothetical protein